MQHPPKTTRRRARRSQSEGRERRCHEWARAAFLRRVNAALQDCGDGALQFRQHGDGVRVYSGTLPTPIGTNPALGTVRLDATSPSSRSAGIGAHAHYSSRVWPVLLLCTLLLASCGGSPKKAASDAAGVETGKVLHKLELPMPSMMLSDSARLEFMAAHYWDKFDFADTTWIADTAALEQTFANWSGLLAYLPAQKAVPLAGGLIRRAETSPPMLLRLAEIAEHYFYNPNSPMRNEELYIPVLEAMIAAPGIDEVYKIRPRAQLETALKNRPGMNAADFVYTTSSGRTGKLSGMRGDYTLLFFYNPDCRDCRRVEEYIAASPVFAELLNGKGGKRLAVLAVYLDEDITLWRAHLPQMPAGWTVGYDAQHTIYDTRLYDLQAIPTLYLLDQKKRVVLKDAPVEQIEAWLNRQDAP